MSDAHTSQTSELHTTNSSFNGVVLSSRIMPAALAPGGGDWCETFVISGDVIALSIGDVCGHGIEKFSTMVATRQAIRDAARRGLDPAQTLAEANRFLRRYDPQEHATALFGLLNTRKRSLIFANAGHPPPIMAGPLESLFLEFPESDLPLGIEAESLPTLRTVGVPAATLLVLYTDGVSEREQQPLVGGAQLHEATRFAYHFSRVMTAEVIEKQLFLSGSNIDDAAILTARMPLPPIVRKLHAGRYMGNHRSNAFDRLSTEIK